MRINLAELVTEQRNPNSLDIDLKSTEEIIEIFHEENRNVLSAVEAVSGSIAEGVQLITDAFRHGGRLFYIGAGTSGRLGVLDASECPPTFSAHPDMVQGIIAGGDRALRRSVEAAEDKPDMGAQAIRERCVTEQDVLVGIASSGYTPYVIGALKEAHNLGAKTIFLCCIPAAEYLSEFVDVCIAPIVGPEIITGSTRLKAGTATKLVLNMLSTISMIKIGKVYNNLMVDLQSSNAKLTDRGIRIIMEVTGADSDTAQDTLARAAGSVKTAIVMLAAGVEYDDAVDRLQAQAGVLRRVLEDVS
ncbi:MAG: N-acetylmuramic acid 6-phosphate etherase [Candidatus Poribacteria bacterium]|nr:N-acetylmuramic acid 6-phosphate etherase [Candidatus Poribacteria bacterium]MDE0502943.1 N-acetylmuramic acid 6-phosphate etherase [Candidatus Poribacteria bacterium]